MKKGMKLAVRAVDGLLAAGMLAQTSGAEKSVTPKAGDQPCRQDTQDPSTAIRLCDWSRRHAAHFGVEGAGSFRDAAGASRRQDFDAVAERCSGGGPDSVAIERLDYGETEEVHCRSASHGGGDGDEQPADFCDRRSAHTGPMTLLPHMTMLQALSQAGFTQFANLKGIYLLRTENGKQEKLPFNYKEVIKGNHPEQNIVLKPGDTVVVP